MSFDLKIRGGLVYDGDGGAPIRADIGVRDGVIAEIGPCAASADREIDAEGAIVTPGFVDLHTHYDGQASWDGEMRPSVNHGVTTAVMGNCGVGFAPARESDRDRLIRLMEGVEDIPGTALSEGIEWEWESFPQYLDALAARQRTIDVAAYVPHDPVRVFAMGERALAEERASENDIAHMRTLVSEALDAGAVGFSIGRTDVHRTADGEWTPSSEAAASELSGIAQAFRGRTKGVLQGVSDFNLEREGDQFAAEWAVMEAFIRAGGRPASISLMQRDMAPDQWRRIIEGAEKLKTEGLDLRLQTAPRAIGVFNGLQCTFHPIMAFPSYLAIKDLPLAERVRTLKDPAYKAKMMAETPVKLAGPGSSVPPIVDLMIEVIDDVAKKLFRLDERCDYEQSAAQSMAAEAERDGVSVMSKLYDVLIEDKGRRLLYFPIYNYTEMNYDNVLTMMRHPLALPGLSDGGAHVGTICDASFPTFLLSYWTRDRQDGGRIELSRAVEMMTSRTADFIGFSDRGRLQTGKKADVNVIDYETLRLGPPRMIRDLPAGGQRLLQPVSGYRATLVSGEPVVLNDRVTDARPGRVVRG